MPLQRSRLPAASGIPAYWIVNLADRCVEAFRDPVGDGEQARYQHATRYDSPQPIPVDLGGSTIGQIDLREVFG